MLDIKHVKFNRSAEGFCQSRWGSGGFPMDKTLRHRDRSAGFESVLTMPNCPGDRTVECILTELPGFQHLFDLDICFYLFFSRSGFLPDIDPFRK
jgi:hypothetical protein